MILSEREYKKQEKVNGIIYNMSPAPNFKHSIINGNIYRMIANGLQDSLCLVFMENLDFHFHPDINDDYYCPDIMIICDRKHLKGSSYSGTPKFIMETSSPSTAKKDRSEKKDAYEQSGIEEYWVISPNGNLEIFYLNDNQYILEQKYILQNDPEEEDYNADTEICLRAFPHIKMTLEDIFRNVN